MNPLIVLTALTTISLSFAQNFDQFGINGNGMAPGQASLYPFLPPPPPQPMNGGPPHGPGPHGPGHVHVPHPESPLDLFRQTPRHGGPAGPAGPAGSSGPSGPMGYRGPPPVGPYSTGLRLPGDFQFPMGLPPQSQFRLPPPYPGPMDQLIAQQVTSTVECSCSISFGIQNSSSLVLPRAPQSLFPGIICGPGAVSLCRIQCMAQALNASFDLINQAVNPVDGNGVSLQQFVCGNQVNTTTEIGSTTPENNSRMVNIKSETSCSEQSTDYSSTNRRTESIALGPQECNTIANIGSFQLPSIPSSAVPSTVN